jgi:hypothetical protein
MCDLKIKTKINILINEHHKNKKEINYQQKILSLKRLTMIMKYIRKCSMATF